MSVDYNKTDINAMMGEFERLYFERQKYMQAEAMKKLGINIPAYLSIVGFLIAAMFNEPPLWLLGSSVGFMLIAFLQLCF